MDIQMPGGNGIHALKKIRESGSTCTVVMLTNYPYPQYREASLDAGADFFLDKSTEFEKVPEILLGLMRDLKARGNEAD